MTRTDIHRPSAINPADYDFIAVKYIGSGAAGDAMFAAESRRIIAEHISRTGGKYSTHEHGGTCHVCGAMALYLAVYHHPKTNTYICVGEDCAEKMDLFGGDFQSIRKQVAKTKAFTTGKAKAQSVLEARGVDQRAWMIYSATARDDFQFEERTIADLVSKLVAYGSLSDKQWAFMDRLFEKIDARAGIESAREAERAADAARSQYVGKIGERIIIEGTIFFTTDYETAYGTTYVTGIKDAAGNVFIQKGVPLGRKGDELTIKATVKDHSERDGVKQTIISRPKEI
jgi:hypothetical protein